MTVTAKSKTAPSRKKTSRGEDILYAIGHSALGAVLVASSTKGIIAILLDDEPGDLVQHLRDRFPTVNLISGDKTQDRVLDKVIDFLDTPGKNLKLPLDIRGTDFQCRVWKSLLDLPSGQTITYRDVAKKIGAPRSMRAVGSACAASILSMVVPCHRVLRSDGSPAGGGHFSRDRQLFLIRREAKD